MKELNMGILISSPSDCRECRKHAWNVINETNSRFRSIWLKALPWEKSLLRGIGDPQCLINEQLVKPSHMCVAIFNGRLGTPTRDYDSGTVEEIELMRKDKKPVFIFFKKEPKCRDFGDSENELERLRKYQNKIKETRSFCYSEYENEWDFRELWRQQLEQYIYSLLERHNSGFQMENYEMIQNNGIAKAEALGRGVLSTLNVLSTLGYFL